VGYDDRNGHLYVADGKNVLIYKWKKPDAPIAVIEVPTEHYLEDIDYSIIENKAYATDPVGRQIWEINRKKKEAKAIVSSAMFDQLKLGAPERVSVSVDGRRLFVTTLSLPENPVETTGIVRVQLRENEVDVAQKFPSLTCLKGLGTYRQHFVVSDCQSGDYKQAHITKGSFTDVAVPLDLPKLPVALEVDVDYAVVAIQPSDESQASLIRFILRVKG
jgi:hypothetical protein